MIIKYSSGSVDAVYDKETQTWIKKEAEEVSDKEEKEEEKDGEEK